MRIWLNISVKKIPKGWNFYSKTTNTTSCKTPKAWHDCSRLIKTGRNCFSMKSIFLTPHPQGLSVCRRRNRYMLFIPQALGVVQTRFIPCPFHPVRFSTAHHIPRRQNLQDGRNRSVLCGSAWSGGELYAGRGGQDQRFRLRPAGEYCREDKGVITRAFNALAVSPCIREWITRSFLYIQNSLNNLSKRECAL
jgi:hypothetical protein